MSEDIPIENPIETSFEFTHQNPFQIDIPSSKENENIAYPGFVDSAGVFETAKEEFESVATVSRLTHMAESPITEPAPIQAQYFYPDVNDKFYQPAPPGWTPKVEIDKQTNIDPKFIPRLLDAKSPADF